MVNSNHQGLRIHVYADGASDEQMLTHYHQKTVKGFTTNPTLMAKAGVQNYEAWAKKILWVIKDLPISFEVFSDEIDEMRAQARKLASLGQNVNVKIPVMTTQKIPTYSLVRQLLDEGITINVTAVMTRGQVQSLREILKPSDPVIISIFAGRIADTGRDPMPLMKEAVDLFGALREVRILWASPREILNLYQAEECGCHIITMPGDLLSKIRLRERPLEDFSLETVKMFREDALRSGFTL